MNIESQFLVSCLTSADRVNLFLSCERKDFTLGEIQRCYDIISDYSSQCQPIDLPTLYTEYCTRHGSGKQIDYLMTEPLTVFPENLKKQIKKERLHRDVNTAARQVIEDVKAGRLEVESLALQMEKLLERIDVDESKEAHNSQLSIDQFIEPGKQLKKIATGYSEIDSRIGGLYEGQLVIIAARPGVGKSLMSQNIIMLNKAKTLFFSLEMKRHELYSRMLSFETGINSRAIEDQTTTPDQRERLKEAHEKLKKDLDVTFCDKYGSFNEIFTRIKTACEKDKPELIVIDYLQLISGASGDNTTERLATMTRALKMLAHKYEVPIILISQLSRNSSFEKREPELSDLRGSGAIEQDADVVLMLWREDESQTSKDKDTRLKIAKGRKGGSGGVINLRLLGDWCKLIEGQTSYVKKFGNI